MKDYHAPEAGARATGPARDDDPTLALFGRDMFGNVKTAPRRGPVAERFTFPPFSVLDGRSGEWRERKRAWMRLGIRGEVGRDSELIFSGTSKAKSLDFYRHENGNRTSTQVNGTSVFDPVLCEIAYRWFSPPKGQVVDPFAGGSVRGIVAGMTDRAYWGCDLRAEQIEANEAQADEINPDPRPRWVVGDSRLTLPDAPMADLVFSCPPYGDLERYSDDPSDLSAMDWGAFREAYREIIAASVQRLKPDRFACFVVGDFRDKRGNYRNFVGETVGAFIDAGCELYNEAILLTSIGSAAMRVTKQFRAGRKLCKVHQNVLIFVKGDGKRAARACGDL